MQTRFDPSAEQQTFHHVVCERLMLAISDCISNEELQAHQGQIEAFFPAHIDGLVLRMHQYVAALGDESLNIERTYPATWWQAVRQRWCPAWWLGAIPLRWSGSVFTS